MYKRQVGGRVPSPFDAVYAMTSKDITSDLGRSVAGQAECVEGGRNAYTAFAIGEAHRDPFYGAVIAAHEIGHLFGAHHHYMGCGQGLANLTSRPNNVCSIMSPDIGLGSLNFAPVEAAAVRAHLAHKHAE